METPPKASSLSQRHNDGRNLFSLACTDLKVENSLLLHAPRFSEARHLVDLAVGFFFLAPPASAEIGFDEKFERD